MLMSTKEKMEEKYCPLIGKNCISDICVYWTYSDGWNDTSYPSRDNNNKGYCKHLVALGRK